VPPRCHPLCCWVHHPFNMEGLLVSPAVCRESTAVGTYFNEMARICSP
jgi:hypothetical protein